MNHPIYMDNHATTRVDPRVVEVMLPFLTENYGNAGSVNHTFGWEAKDAVECARASIAAAIGASPREIVFTSGATESNNLALLGALNSVRHGRNHVVSVVTEHKAILGPLDCLRSRGFNVTLLPVAKAGTPHAGIVDVEQFAAALQDKTASVSVMLANNEIGAIQPVAEIARICQKHGISFHCDATQAVGRIPVNVDELGVDLMSFSAHKFYGPKGVGALFVRHRGSQSPLAPQIVGGGQERGLRSGTLNVPSIVGFAKALELCVAEMPHEIPRLSLLRAELHRQLAESIEGIHLNGPILDSPFMRLPNNLNVSFAGVEGEELLMKLKGLAVSSGAACTSANPEPSHVLLSLSLPEKLVRASLRFGLGRFNTIDDVSAASEIVSTAVRRVRGR